MSACLCCCVYVSYVDVCILGFVCVCVYVHVFLGVVFWLSDINDDDI